MITFEQLWSDKYAALAAHAAAEEDSRRAEDFIDVSRLVCGLPLRAMTPRDLLILDYDKNPFISGGEITAPRIAQFLCALHCEPPRGWWADRKFFKHCAALLMDDSEREIHAYLDRIFADQIRRRGGAQGKPLGTHFVAPLIVRLAAGIPSLTPQAIMDTPFPQLFQFQKVIEADAAAQGRGKFREITATDRYMGECLAEVNRLNQQGSENVAEASALPMRSPEQREGSAP